MKIYAFSDIHGRLPVDNVEADVMIFAGDMGIHNNPRSLIKLCTWMKNQKATHKLFVAGNHDLWIERNKVETKDICRDFGVHYLQNESMVLDGIKYYGSPYVPRFYDWAFMLSHKNMQANWDLIPLDTDILITHGPAYGVLDFTHYGSKEHIGCLALAEKISELKNLKLHVFGHNHENPGVEVVGDSTRANVSEPIYLHV